jgi:hypothetical protein
MSDTKPIDWRKAWQFQDSELKFVSPFGDAPVKTEGRSVNVMYGFPEDYHPEPPAVETTYVERRVPTQLEDEAHELIDTWLKSKGYDPEEI